MQHALMHKRLQRLTHTNIHISPEEEGPRGLHGAICVENRQHTQKGRKTPHLSRRRTLGRRIVDAAADRKWSQHPDDRQVGSLTWPSQQANERTKTCPQPPSEAFTHVTNKAEPVLKVATLRHQ